MGWICRGCLAPNRAGLECFQCGQANPALSPLPSDESSDAPESGQGVQDDGQAPRSDEELLPAPAMVDNQEGLAAIVRADGAVAVLGPAGGDGGSSDGDADDGRVSPTRLNGHSGPLRRSGHAGRPRSRMAWVGLRRSCRMPAFNEARDLHRPAKGVCRSTLITPAASTPCSTLGSRAGWRTRSPWGRRILHACTALAGTPLRLTVATFHLEAWLGSHLPKGSARGVDGISGAARRCSESSFPQRRASFFH